MKQPPKEINGVAVVSVLTAFAPIMNPRVGADKNRVLPGVAFLEMQDGRECYYCMTCGRLYSDSDWKKAARSMVSHLSHHKRNGENIVTEFSCTEHSTERISDSIVAMADNLIKASRSATEFAQSLFSASEKLAELFDLLEAQKLADSETIDKAARFDKMKDLLG